MANIEIYTSSLCPYCYEAKRILNRYAVSYHEISIIMILGWKFPNNNFKSMLHRTGGKKTVPQIIINDDYYGDEDTLKVDEAAGKLAEILSQ
jgi:glutaredoxin 3